MTFIVENLEKTVKRIKSTGAPIRTSGDVFEVRDGVFMCIIDDPEGNHLEFVEYENIAAYRTDIV